MGVKNGLKRVSARLIVLWRPELLWIFASVRRSAGLCCSGPVRSDRYRRPVRMAYYRPLRSISKGPVYYMPVRIAWKHNKRTGYFQPVRRASNIAFSICFSVFRIALSYCILFRIAFSVSPSSAPQTLYAVNKSFFTCL